MYFVASSGNFLFYSLFSNCVLRFILLVFEGALWLSLMSKRLN